MNVLKYDFSIRENPESWTYTLNDIDEINNIFEEYVSKTYGDTVYIKMRNSGKIQIEGDFDINQLKTIIGIVESVI